MEIYFRMLVLLGFGLRVSVPSESASSPGSVVLGVHHDSVERSPCNGSKIDIIEPLSRNILEILCVRNSRVSLGSL